VCAIYSYQGCMHSCTRLALDRFTSRSQSESESSSPLYACPDLRINRGIREHTRMKIDTEARRVAAHFTSCRIDSCARQPPPRRIAFSSREYLPPTTLCPPPPARPGLSTLRQVQVPDFRRCLARTSIFRAARARARASIRSDPSLRNPPLNSSKSPPPSPLAPRPSRFLASRVCPSRVFLRTRRLLAVTPSTLPAEAPRGHAGVEGGPNPPRTFPTDNALGATRCARVRTSGALAAVQCSPRTFDESPMPFARRRKSPFRCGEGGGHPRAPSSVPSGDLLRSSRARANSFHSAILILFKHDVVAVKC